MTARGFPMNRRFQFRVSSGELLRPPVTACPTAQHIINGVALIDFSQSCISRPVSYDFFCGPNVNYFAVTYQGPVNWWQKSTVGTDDDYNYRMYPSNNNGTQWVTIRA